MHTCFAVILLQWMCSQVGLFLFLKIRVESKKYGCHGDHFDPFFLWTMSNSLVRAIDKFFLYLVM